jgi:hypothetical protein
MRLLPLIVGCTLSWAAACSPSLTIQSWHRVGVREVQEAYDALPNMLKKWSAEVRVFVTPGAVTDIRRYHWLAHEPPPGRLASWADVPMMYDAQQNYVIISAANTEAYFRGYSTLEEELWHAIDSKHGFSRAEGFRAIAEPLLRWYPIEQHGSADRVYAEIFAELADRLTDSDGDIIHQSYPEFAANMQQLFEALETFEPYCNTHKDQHVAHQHVR